MAVSHAKSVCMQYFPETKPSPRGEGGERSEPDRVLAV